MAMSKRRFQFLDQLVELYQIKRSPVHYEALANAIGVSKWTAYDMLKEIEKSGYVTRSYEVNKHETGRSQVVFAPTDKAVELFKQQRSHSMLDQHSQHGMESIRDIQRLLDNVKHTNIQDILKEMLNKIPEGGSNLEFCGYILGIFMVYLKKIGGKTESIIRLLVDKATSHHASVLMFVGTVLGTVIQSISEDIGSEITELVGQYLEMIGNLTDGELQLLSDFIKDEMV